MLLKLPILMLGIVAIIQLQSPAVSAQDNDKQQPITFVSADSLKLSSNGISQISVRTKKLEKKLESRTLEMLAYIKKEDAELVLQISHIDSARADLVRKQNNKRYEALEKQLKNIDARESRYNAYLDTLTTSLKFLKANSNIIGTDAASSQKLETALINVQNVSDEFRKAEIIEKFLANRQQLLNEQLTELGFDKQLGKLNKKLFYYKAAIAEYKSILKGSKKAERKAIELLSQTRLFKSFMARNGHLASLLGPPIASSNPLLPGSGLQTRSQVNEFILDNVGTEPNSLKAFQTNLSDAKAKMDELRNVKENSENSSEKKKKKANRFKPNNQRVKSFKERLVYNTDFQTQKVSNFFPATTDLSLSLGYKLNDRSVIGIGASYKLGLGEGIRRIKFSHQGMGIRSFLDWKLKGSFWLTGGYEQNFRPPTNFNGIWYGSTQESGLVGVSKVIALKSKFFKKTSVKLLWDFLSYQQLPKTQPILFRVGYTF